MFGSPTTTWPRGILPQENPWRNNPSTHIDYGRITHKTLTEQGIEHEYWEHDVGHSLGQGGIKGVEHFLSRLPATRRDPYHPHVVAATPTGFIREWRYPSPENRWVSIRKRTQGFLPYDLITRLGAWEGGRGEWRLRHWRGRLPGSSVEAVNRGDNRIEATAMNVAQFSVWLHPKMVDFAQPIQVVVNDSIVVSQRVKPSISDALRSFERRRDWGLLYTAELKVDVPAAPPAKDSSRRRKH